VRRGFSLKVAEEIVGKVIPDLDVESRRYQVELLLSDSDPDTITVEAGVSLHQSLTEPDTSQFSNMIGMMRDGLFYELGVRFPPVRLVANEAIPTFDFRVNVLKLRGPIFTGLGTGEFFVNAAALDVEKSLKIDARSIPDPVTGVGCAIVKGEDAASRCEREMNATTWGAAGFVVLAIAHVLRTNAEQLLTAANVQAMLAKLSEAFPLLIVNILERFPPRFVLDVLRALVREGFSVRDLRGIFEAMLELDGAMPSVACGEVAVIPPSAKLSHWEVRPTEHQAAEHCADSVRVAMKRYVTSQFAKGGQVTVLEVSGAAEARLRRCPRRIRGQEHKGLVSAIAEAIGAGGASQPLVALTAVDLRRRVREAIEIEFPHIAVVCHEELEDGIGWRSNINWPEA
jgi:type III secretion protein V